MSVITASIEQLEQAAEQTIEVAAAAMLWAGQDSRGVLEHVARASAARMAQSRRGYAFLQSCRLNFAADEQRAFDESLSNIVLSTDFEVAALPAAAAPPWTEAVCAAMNEALDDNRDITMQRNDAAVRLRALHVSVRYHALMVCSYWGQDPLPINEIETGAQILSAQTSSACAAEF